MSAKEWNPLDAHIERSRSRGGTGYFHKPSCFIQPQRNLARIPEDEKKHTCEVTDHETKRYPQAGLRKASSSSKTQRATTQGY